MKKNIKESEVKKPAEAVTKITHEASAGAGTGHLIKTEGLKKSFYVGLPNEVEILKGINVEIEKGDFVIIFGPSGCGKSTLLHTLLGLEPPTSGSVMLENNDYYAMTEDDRATYRRHHVGIIYQQPLWIASLNVAGNVTFTLKLLDLEDEKINTRVDEVLNLVGMQAWKNSRPQELSSGQQQKISLARALSVDPVVIVADEPTGNLDTISGQQLIEHFMEFNKKGITIIMVTHDLEYLKYGNKIIHMIDGMVIEQYIGKAGQPFNRESQGKKGGDSKGVNVRDPKFLSSLEGKHDGKIIQLVAKVEEPKQEVTIPPESLELKKGKPVPVTDKDFVEGINVKAKEKTENTEKKEDKKL